MNSIIQYEKECYFCRALADREGYTGELAHSGLHKHHVMYGGGRRSLSEQYGLWIWLCPYHHTLGPEAVHTNKEIRRSTERIAQKAWETKRTRKEWVEVFGRNYLD